MSTMLNTRPELAPTPFVQVSETVGSKFKGMYVSAKEANGAMGKLSLHTFQVIDSTMNFVIKNAAGEYVPTDVKAGTDVVINAKTRLKAAFSQAQAGDILTITYLGRGKQPKRGGTPAHEYTVEKE